MTFLEISLAQAVDLLSSLDVANLAASPEAQRAAWDELTKQYEDIQNRFTD